MNQKPPVADHPRNHALIIAAANTLHNAGHLPAAKRAQIAAKARAKINQMKGAGHYMMNPPQRQPAPFGSLAPDMENDSQ